MYPFTSQSHLEIHINIEYRNTFEHGLMFKYQPGVTIVAALTNPPIFKYLDNNIIPYLQKRPLHGREVQTTTTRRPRKHQAEVKEERSQILEKAIIHHPSSIIHHSVICFVSYTLASSYTTYYQYDYYSIVI